MKELRDVLEKRKFRCEDSIIITSDTRSGSTWLMELLNNIPDSVLHWEPLHPKFGIVPQEFKWGNRPYIPEEDNHPHYLSLMQDILTLKKCNDWTLSFCYINRAFTAERVIIKFVRANLLLPWIVKNFPLKHKPILLLRHPVAVALSQFETFRNEKREIRTYEVPDCINNERFAENAAFIESLASPLQKKVAFWCINHLSTINHKEHGQSWLCVYYEDLLFDPGKELERILLGIGLQVNKEILQTIDYKKPSATKSKDLFEDDPVKQLNKWADILTAEEKQGIQKVLDHYGITFYSAFSASPLKKKTLSDA